MLRGVTRSEIPYALAAFLVPLVIFVASVPHEPASWDTAELQGVPYILGIAHPTGFPLYVLLGYLFSHIFAFDTVAFRLNVFSALCVSIACLASYFAAREITVPKVCAVVGAIWFAVTDIVWTHAARAEAHDLALAFSAWAIVYVLRWVRRGLKADVFRAAALIGLGMATHPTVIWLIPGFVVGLLVRPAERKEMLSFAGLVVACLLLYAYLPIRSWIVVHEHLDPAYALSGLESSIFWNYNNPSSFGGFVKEVSGSQFGVASTLTSILNPTSMQSVLWQWLTIVNTEFGAFGLCLAFFGFAVAWSRNWRLALLLFLAATAAVPFSFAYAAEGDTDRYRMLSLWVIPIFAGSAAVASRPVTRPELFARTVLVFVLMTLWTVETFQNNTGLFQKRSDTGGRTLLTEAAKAIPPGSIIVTGWIDATSLAYGAYVDGSLRGRIIVSGGWNEYSASYPVWSKTHAVYLLGNGMAPPKGIRTVSVPPIDSYHPIWKIK